MTGNPQEPSELDIDELGEDDLFDDDLDEIVLLADGGEQSTSSGWKKKTVTRQRRSRPAQWDDDWYDPADDLMYGFDDTQDN